MAKHAQQHASGGKAPADKSQGSQELPDPSSLAVRLRDANEAMWARIGPPPPTPPYPHAQESLPTIKGTELCDWDM